MEATSLPGQSPGPPEILVPNSSLQVPEVEVGGGATPGWTFREGFPGPPLNALLWPWDQWPLGQRWGPPGMPSGATGGETCSWTAAPPAPGELSWGGGRQRLPVEVRAL